MKIPAVEIGEFAGRIWSFDTRRLIAFQMAGVNVRYRKITPAEVLGKLSNFDRQGSHNGRRCAIRQGGKHSEARIHDNPAFKTPQDGKFLTGSPGPPACPEDMSVAEFESSRKVLEMLAHAKPRQQLVYPPPSAGAGAGATG